MPGLFHTALSRRTFLKYTGIGGGILGIQAQAGEEKESTRWALLSDTHIPQDTSNEYRGFRPFDNLKSIIPDLVQSKTEGVMISGDLARLEGLVGDYANLKSLLKPVADTRPVCMALGNHDHREHFLKTFPSTEGKEQSVNGKWVVVLESSPVRFILLDSLLYVNRVAGLLGKSQRQWLEQYLQASDNTPTFLIVHHTLGDNDGDLLDVERLFRLIKPHNKVKGIIYGHSHAYSHDMREGIHLINLPAIGYNFRDSEPVGWIEAEFYKDRGRFVLHAFKGNTSHDEKMTTLDWRV